MGNVILGLLLLSPMTLYLLNKQFERSISLIYSASLGSIRTAVLSLAARGLVESVDSVENGRSKKTYHPTPEGQAEFFRWMAAPIVGGDLETQALSKLFFLGLLPDDAARVAVLRDIVDRARADEGQLREVEGELEGMQVPEPLREIFRYQKLTLEYGVRSHEVGREFFQRVLADLER